MLVFAVETSCDETSVCIMDKGKNIYSHIIFSQEIHKRYGGVVPELASRAHLEILQNNFQISLFHGTYLPTFFKFTKILILLLYLIK